MEKKNGSNLTVLKKIRHERTLLITLAHNQCNKRKLVYNKIIESDLLAISKTEKGLQKDQCRSVYNQRHRDWQKNNKNTWADKTEKIEHELFVEVPRRSEQAYVEEIQVVLVAKRNSKIEKPHQRL